MPTIIKQRIHLNLITNPTQLLLLISNLKRHRPLPVPFSLLESPRVHVPCLGVHYLPLAVGLVGLPFARVGVAVCVGHGAVAGFGAGGEVAGVGVAGEGDEGAGAVGDAVLEAEGGVGGAEVGS